MAGAGDNPLTPDVALAAGATLAYELRRQVHVNQRIARDFVTLTATSRSTNESDNVTGTVLLAAVTRARLGGLKVDPAGVVEFSTLMQQGTLGFNLYETDEPSVRGTLHPLNASFVASPFRDSVVPILYRVETGPVSRRYIVFEEVETTGKRRMMGPFEAVDASLARAFERTARRFDRAGVPGGAIRTLSTRWMGHLMRQDSEKRRGGRRPQPSRPRPDVSGVKIEIAQAGPVEVSLQALRENGLVPAGRFQVWNQGMPVPASVRPGEDGAPALVFEGQSLSTDYTGRNAYVVTSGGRGVPLHVPLTRSASPAPAGTVRVERNTIYVAVASRSATIPGSGSSWPPSGATGRTRGGIPGRETSTSPGCRPASRARCACASGWWASPRTSTASPPASTASLWASWCSRASRPRRSRAP